MRQFHPLTVGYVRRETADALRIGLEIPEDLRDVFSFQPGQHVPIELTIDGKRVRRTYSLCSAPGTFPLEIGVRVQEGGLFSGYLAEHLAPGQTLDVMPPVGQFHAEPDPTRRRTAVGVCCRQRHNAGAVDCDGNPGGGTCQSFPAVLRQPAAAIDDVH